MRVDIQNLKAADLPAMIALEREAWPEDTQATDAHLKDRVETFPEGVFGAFCRGNLIGMATCQRVDLIDFARLPTWRELTADGWISCSHVADGLCLHFVSICVHPRYRSRRVGHRLNEARLDLARYLGALHAFTDTRLAGLASFLGNGIGREPCDYLNAILKGKLSDPVVSMYLDLNFRPIGLVPDCMRSDRESAGFGLAMLRVLDS